MQNTIINVTVSRVRRCVHSVTVREVTILCHVVDYDFSWPRVLFHAAIPSLMRTNKAGVAVLVTSVDASECSLVIHVATECAAKLFDELIVHGCPVDGMHTQLSELTLSRASTFLPV